MPTLLPFGNTLGSAEDSKSQNSTFFIRTDETETENVSRNVKHACNVSTRGSVTQREILPIPYDATQRIKHLDSWLFSR